MPFGIYLLVLPLKACTVEIFYRCLNFMLRVFACMIWLISTMLFDNIVVFAIKEILIIGKLI